MSSTYGDDASVSGTLLVTGSTTFNEDSHPTYDFRVESDSRPYALWVDSGNDRVGLGCFVEPNNTLEIHHEGGDADQGIMIIRYDGAVYTNNLLGGIGFDSADPVATRPSSPTGSGAYIISYAAENHSATNKGGYLTFGTKATGVGNDADATERMRIAADGKIGIGTSDPQEQLQVIGTARVLKNNNSAGAKAKLILAKSKGTEGSPTVMSSGDTIGSVEFNAYDGDTFETAAEIYAKVDTTPGDGDMPGALYFATTADGAASTTDRMVIDSAGSVGIGTTSPKVPLDVYEMGGLILGYTMLNNGDAAGNASYTITTSYVVPSADWKVVFKAPASGKVEIQFLGYLASAATGNNYVYMGLSDNATYNTLGAQYEKQIFEPDEDDNIMLTHSWYVTGLTAGTAYTYYIGTKGTATGHYWYYGGTNADENPPIIIRAVALPNTVATD